MVKNTKGGSQHKKFARKSQDDNERARQKTRLANPNEPCEMYGNITKLFGHGMCEVKCNDGMKRMCMIRKKFTGKNKQQNAINLDTKVLVGIRDWEIVKSDKLQKCDLLEVYERYQVNDIKNDPKTNWHNLMGESDKIVHQNNNNSENLDSFEFTYDNDDTKSETSEASDKSLNIDDL